MEVPEPIRVLIVDDSRIFRGLLQAALEQIPNVLVVGSVFSGEKALELIDTTRPDVITLDVEMPGMGGLETLQEIVRRNQRRKSLPPIDTILVSALTKHGSRIAIEGLQLGAIDFICKPAEADPITNAEALRRALVEKLSIFRHRRGFHHGTSRISAPTLPSASSIQSRPQGRFQAIAIGTSTGGPEALGNLLPSLATRCQAPIFIVQHILAGLSQYLAESLSKKCGRAVIEAYDDLEVRQGGIYLAKSGKHMLIRSKDGVIRMGVSDSPPENGCKPAVDVFLRAAASVYGSSLVSVILTGMGDDGAAGVRAVKRAGGYIIAQDEASCVVYGMPQAAVATGAVDEILPILKIADGLLGLFATGTKR